MRKGRFKVIDGGRRWMKPQTYQPRPPRSGGRWWRYSGLWLGAVFVGLVVGLGPSWNDGIGSEGSGEPQALLSGQAVRASFGLCHSGGGYNCVVDGDTIWIKGQNVRVADIDAPETHEPRCAEEKSLGDRATQRLRQLVNSGVVTLSRIDRDEDSYGRKLRIVKVDGVSVGETLVKDGLVRRYAGGKRPWC